MEHNLLIVHTHKHKKMYYMKFHKKTITINHTITQFKGKLIIKDKTKKTLVEEHYHLSR